MTPNPTIAVAQANGVSNGGSGKGEETSVRSVCVIGCGPGGMFFCHNMNKMMAMQREEGSSNGGSAPATKYDVQCFEATSNPGGVWRKADKANTTNAVEMYDNLWTNGPSYAMELYDYTFKEYLADHGKEEEGLTTYLQRQTVLDYITTRVTKGCPDFFERYVQFNTKVLHVEWKDDLNKFEVTTQKVAYGGEVNATGDFPKVTQLFDYCFWAGGANGKQKMPAPVLKRLEGFQGDIIHSADTAHLEELSKDKHVLLIGGEYSAEDLAIQMIKLGVGKVSIISRSTDPHCSSTESWPGGKVNAHYGRQINSVSSQNGKTVILEAVEWEFPNRYYKEEEQPPLEELTVADIDTIIFCTGYERNCDMLHPSLRSEDPGRDNCAHQRRFKVPDDWKMVESPVTKYFGEVKPDECLHQSHFRQDLFFGVKISNPHMFLLEEITDNPMLDIDVATWYYASLITGRIELPKTKEEMLAINDKIGINAMKSPHLRVCMDKNYFEVTEKVWDELGDDEELDDAWSAASYLSIDSTMEILGLFMRTAKYPVDIGTLNDLNEKGKRLSDMNTVSETLRWSEDLEECNKSTDRKDWRTFRDTYDKKTIRSIFTDESVVPLKKSWLDMD